MTPSIRGRLTASLVVALAALVAAAGLFLHVRLEANLVEDLDGQLELEAREMLEVLEHEPAWPGEHADDGLLGSFQEIEAAFYYEMWAPDGRVVLRMPASRSVDLPQRLAAANLGRGFDVVLPTGRAGRAFAVPIRPHDWATFSAKHRAILSAADGSKEGAVIVAATSVHEIHRLLQELRISLGAVLLATVLVTAAVVGVTVRRALRPLDRLTAAAAAVGADDLTIRFSEEGAPRELRPIHRCLDELLQRIEHAFARERRFNSDVAHELRTPVAELKTMCEVALRFPDSPRDHEGTLRQAGEVADQMEALINVLLRLRRVEAGEEALDETDVDLVALMRHAFEQLAPRIAERRLAVELALPAAAPLRADRTLLAAIVGNLASNAVEHAPEAGTIRAGIEVVDGRRRLEIANPAPALAPGDLPHLFEPFWRKDRARSRGLHAGLGLALARTFAERLGLRIAATLAADGTLRVAVEWPAPA